MAEQRSLWDLLADIVQQRDQLLVDEEGEVMRLGEMDELLAAKHIKRLVTQWGNRRRGSSAPAPLPGQIEMPGVGEGGTDGGGEPAPGPEPGAGIAPGLSPVGPGGQDV